MAKRRKEKDEEDEDKPFKVPKFDEEAFLKRERRNIKATFLAFLFGILMAFVCFGFWALMGSGTSLRWGLVFLVCIANIAFIRYIFIRLNLDLTDFTKKNWFTVIMVYFFTWLLVFIVLVNPPIYDDEAPFVELAVLPEIQEPGGNITIVAKITDNVGVNTNDISLEITDPDDNTTLLSPVEFMYHDLIVKYVYENTENLQGDFDFTLTATDKNGLVTTESGSFSYDEDAIEIAMAASRFENLTHGDEFTIDVDEDISSNNFRVYYTLNDGDEINVNRKDSNKKDEYESSPAYEGWEQNSNYTMKVYAEVIYYFDSVTSGYTLSDLYNLKFSNIVKNSAEYEFTTDTDDRIGDDDPLVEYNCTLQKQPENVMNYRLPCPNVIQVPGFEAVLLIISLLVVILIFKYKKKDENNKK